MDVRSGIFSSRTFRLVCSMTKGISTFPQSSAHSFDVCKCRLATRDELWGTQIVVVVTCAKLFLYSITTSSIILERFSITILTALSVDNPLPQSRRIGRSGRCR